MGTHARNINIESISSVRIQDYESVKVYDLIEETSYNFLLAQAQAFKLKIFESNNYLSIQNIHPIATAIIKTVANNDAEKYEKHLSEIDNLILEKKKYDNYKQLQESLRRDLPMLVKEILANTFDFANFSKLENAIHFKHAFAEIEKLLAEDYETILLQRMFDIEQAEEKLVSKVGSMKAWHSVLTSLSSNPQLRRHLQAWALAQSRIGQGTGKRAVKFRREAQNQMEQCKDSVPCWIMPLYKVAEQ